MTACIKGQWPVSGRALCDVRDGAQSHLHLLPPQAASSEFNNTAKQRNTFLGFSSNILANLGGLERNGSDNIHICVDGLQKIVLIVYQEPWPWSLFLGSVAMHLELSQSFGCVALLQCTIEINLCIFFKKFDLVILDICSNSHW